ncbi:MAG: PLP-dependent transferase [Nitrososphaeria archaeon]
MVYDISRRFDRFLICGERIDVDITDLIEFNTDWELEMTKIIAERGRSHTAIDYFVFSKGLWTHIAVVVPMFIYYAAVDLIKEYFKFYSWKIVDIEKLVNFARKNNILTVIDNTFATPVNQNPADFIILHSATKYLSGHSDLILGCAISDNRGLDVKTNKAK